MFPVLLRYNDILFAVREMIVYPKRPLDVTEKGDISRILHSEDRNLSVFKMIKSRPSKLTVRRVSPNCVGSYSGPSESCGRTPPLKYPCSLKGKSTSPAPFALNAQSFSSAIATFSTTLECYPRHFSLCVLFEGCA